MAKPQPETIYFKVSHKGLIESHIDTRDPPKGLRSYRGRRVICDAFTRKPRLFILQPRGNYGTLNKIVSVLCQMNECSFKPTYTFGNAKVYPYGTSSPRDIEQEIIIAKTVILGMDM